MHIGKITHVSANHNAVLVERSVQEECDLQGPCPDPDILAVQKLKQLVETTRNKHGWAKTKIPCKDNVNAKSTGPVTCQVESERRLVLSVAAQTASKRLSPDHVQQTNRSNVSESASNVSLEAQIVQPISSSRQLRERRNLRDSLDDLLATQQDRPMNVTPGLKRKDDKEDDIFCGGWSCSNVQKGREGQWRRASFTSSIASRRISFDKNVDLPSRISFGNVDLPLPRLSLGGTDADEGHSLQRGRDSGIWPGRFSLGSSSPRKISKLVMLFFKALKLLSLSLNAPSLTAPPPPSAPPPPHLFVSLPPSPLLLFSLSHSFPFSLPPSFPLCALARLRTSPTRNIPPHTTHTHTHT